MNKTHFGDTSLGDAIGLALVILAIMLGIGGCNYLSKPVCNHVEQAK